MLHEAKGEKVGQYVAWIQNLQGVIGWKSLILSIQRRGRR